MCETWMHDDRPLRRRAVVLHAQPGLRVERARLLIRGGRRTAGAGTQHLDLYVPLRKRPPGRFFYARTQASSMCEPYSRRSTSPSGFHGIFSPSGRSCEESSPSLVPTISASSGLGSLVLGTAKAGASTCFLARCQASANEQTSSGRWEA